MFQRPNVSYNFKAFDRGSDFKDIKYAIPYLIIPFGFGSYHSFWGRGMCQFQHIFACSFICMSFSLICDYASSNPNEYSFCRAFVFRPIRGTPESWLGGHEVHKNLRLQRTSVGEKTHIPLFQILREAPFNKSPPLFGHCPNSIYPPPPRTQTGTLGHLFSGAILPLYHFYHFFYHFL